MESEPKSLTVEDSIIKDTLFNAEFIGYINSLSKAILDFYKVSKNIHANKDLLINYGKTELNNGEILYNNNENSVLNELTNTLNEIFNKLEFNNKSQENNLSNFFEDAKIIFKKLKEKRQEIIVQIKNFSNSRKMTDNAISSRNSLGKKNKSQKKNEKTFAKSYAYINLNDLQDDVIGLDLKKNKSVNLNEENGMNLNEKNNKRFSSVRKSEYLNSITEDGVENKLGKKKKISPNMSQNELNKLKMINKKLNLELKKYKSFPTNLEELKNNNNNFNVFEKINIFIKDKDKVISSLKEEMDKSDKNHQMILNKYKKRIESLKNENDRLKSNTSLSGINPKSDIDASIISKLKFLMKENQKLKNNIEELKISNYHSEFNAQVEPKLSQFENMDKENKSLQNKIRVLENKFQLKQKESIQLNNQIINITNKYQKEINIISNKNNELSTNLINKENELLNLQKEILNKNSCIENYKRLLNKDINGKQKMNNEEYEKRIQELESNLEKNKELEFNHNKQLSALNQQIKNKDAKILKQNRQLEQIQSQLLSKKAENQKLLNYIDNLKLTNENNNYANNLNEKLKEQQIINNNLNEELNKMKYDNEMLENKILSNEKRISILNQNSDLQNTKAKEYDKLKNENQSLKFENERINYQYNQLRENLLQNDGDKTQKKEEEIEGLKQLIEKLQKEREKGDNDINALKKENEKIKNQMMRLSKTLPEEYNELQKHYNELETKYLFLKNKNPNIATPRKTKAEEKQEEKLSKELAEAKREIEQLKKKNVELVSQLEDKEINKNYYDIRSEDGNKSNYEEEFDLRKMAKGAKDKNRSQDINIDYPGIQTYKEKVRELEFYYNSLENLVKKLLLTIQCNPKNKTYVAELCKIVGFDIETTNKIITNKNKNFILGLFSK